MNITLTGTKIKQDTKLLAFEKNNNVDVINITVDTDESWTYKLDVKYPACSCGDDKYNIIDLMRNGKQLSVMLTSAMLPFAGRYQCQLRGISGDKVYHTDTFDVWVKRSIEPGETYNPVPSEFYQIEKNITEMNNNPPYPSDDGYWMIWDVDTKQYVKSDIKAATGQGAVRYDIAQELTDEQQKQARENIGAIDDTGTMFVTITKSTQDGQTIFTADKTYDEIVAAVKNGVIPVCNNPVDDSTYGPQNVRCIFRNSFYVSGVEYVVFQSEGDEGFYQVLIRRNGKVEATSKLKVMTGATAEKNGTGGTVPEPYAGYQSKFLRGDATWADVETDFVLAHVTTNEDGTYSSDKTYDELREAFEAGKIVGLVPPGDLGYWQDFRAFSNTPFLYLLGTLKGNNIVKLSFAAFAPAPDPSPIFEGGIIYIAFSCTFSPTEITFNPQEITTKLPQIYNFDVTESNGVISSVTTYNQIAQIISLYDTDESDYGYNVRGIANLQATFGGVLYGFVSIDSSKKTAVFSATTKSGVEKLIVTNDGTTDTWTHTVENLSLPTATSTTLGGVKPVTKTDEMTQDVGVDENGKLYTEPTKDGKDGTNGLTPTIGDNGNWYLGTEDTGKPSRGANGDKGDPGADYVLTDADKTEIAEDVIAGGIEAQLGDEPLPAPASASAGQFIRAKTVAGGKVTETETADIPVLPTVTASNNGQFLRVVGGVWAASEIQNANGEEF